MGNPPQPLQAYLDAQKKLINKTLFKILGTAGAYRRFRQLDNSLKHTVLLEGKRLRPIFVLMSFELFSSDTKKALEPAAAIELIHAGSLMLDDLPSMDNAGLRRGKHTNHVLFGDATTILASAALWIEALHIISNQDAPTGQQLVQITTESIGKNGLVLGQYMDLFAFNKKQAIKDLKRCYELKTGSLFKLAGSYGALLGGASAQEKNVLENFGTTFGTAYQIRDDIIDAIKSEKETGKDARKDELNNKPNYVSMLGINGAKEALNVELAAAKKALAQLNKNTIRFQQLIEAISL